MVENLIDKEYKLEELCRRQCFEFEFKQRTYCGHLDDECIYRNKKPDYTDNYRCMDRDKMV